MTIIELEPGLPLGEEQEVDFPSDILWDNDTQILWDDDSVIEWGPTRAALPLIELKG